MQEMRTVLTIGADLPPNAQLLFYPYSQDDRFGKTYRFLVDLGADSTPLKMLDANKKPFSRSQVEGRPIMYAVPVDWDAQGTRRRGEHNSEQISANWRSNLFVALDDASTNRMGPVSVWMEAPNSAEAADAVMGLVSDLAEILGHQGIESYTFSLVAGTTEDVLSDIRDHAARVFPTASISVPEADFQSGASDQNQSFEIVKLQEQLRETGFLKGAADGVVGPQTVDAVRRSMSAQDIEIDDPYVDFISVYPNFSHDVARVIADSLDRKSSQTAPPLASGVDERQIAETAPYYPDDPARIDQLNRKSVAEALATIIDGVWKDAGQRKDDKSFIAHLHGPWGSGKTSILYFLEALLHKQQHPAPPNPNSDMKQEGGPWIVVHYNAWQMQEMGPPWWTVMDTAFRQITDALTDPAARWRHKAQNRWWRFRNGWMPSVIPAAVLLGALIWLLLAAEDSSLIDLSKGAAGLAALVSAIFLLKGDMGLFNVRKAKQYRELAEDPLGPLTARFEAMVTEVGRPVAIFIDDLDRCDAQFVVDLLTQIQTLFRKANVLYVVAGDRDWICSSYEQTYKSFSGKIAAPGHSLGHMFLEKIFQISVEVPDITDDQRKAFLGHLLQGDPDAAPGDLKRAAKAAKDDLEHVTTEAEVIAKNDAFQGTPAEKAVYAAASLKVLHRPELAREREKHILLNYANHLEPNPRAMKRLLNAYGFRRGYDIQAKERSDQDALILWTILENRWPVMASYLGGKTVSEAERDALIALKDDAKLVAIYGQIEWAKLPIVSGAETRFADLAPPTPPQKAA